jgi:tRNA-specific 2-thiouridylase
MTRVASRRCSASTTTSSTTPKSSSATSSRPSSRVTWRGARRTRVSSATVTSKFDLLFERAARLGFDAVATGHHAQVMGSRGPPLSRARDGRSKGSKLRAGYPHEDQLATLLLPIGHLNKSDVRDEAERLGLRTWDKPDSQDVCFIEASKGREVFFDRASELTPATIVDVLTGEALGEQRGRGADDGGPAPRRPAGSRRRKTLRVRVDLVAKRVEVGRLDEILITSLSLDDGSLSFTGDALADGSAVLAQCSAHGRVQPATLRHGENWRSNSTRRPARSRPVSRS